SRFRRDDPLILAPAPDQVCSLAGQPQAAVGWHSRVERTGQSVRPTSARTALPPICFRHIDRRTRKSSRRPEHTLFTVLWRPNREPQKGLCTKGGRWLFPEEDSCFQRRLAVDPKQAYRPRGSLLHPEREAAEGRGYCLAVLLRG